MKTKGHTFLRVFIIITKEIHFANLPHLPFHSRLDDGVSRGSECGY